MRERERGDGVGHWEGGREDFGKGEGGHWEGEGGTLERGRGDIGKGRGGTLGRGRGDTYTERIRFSWKSKVGIGL